MAAQRRTLLPLALAAAAAAAAVHVLRAGFAGGAPAGRPARAAPRRAFESGKVNLGPDVDLEAMPPPTPTIECEEGCMTAIMECLEEGCSVEALSRLDRKLAEDESTILSSLEELSVRQKTAFTQENVGTMAWLKNFINRSQGLRGQLRAMQGIQDHDFIQQMVRAASVAFGGGRQGDYPKVGVSAYSD